MLPREQPGNWYRTVGWLFARDPVSESVATRVRFRCSPRVVWKHILFYEEVPRRAPFLLRTLLPSPVRSVGAKDSVGAMVRCEYAQGQVLKRVTGIRPCRYLSFEVVEQQLGIEVCVLTRAGSYRIDDRGGESDVVLVTRYLAYLRPRFFWRAVEALLVHQLHRHILRGVGVAMLSNAASPHPRAEGDARIREAQREASRV